MTFDLAALWPYISVGLSALAVWLHLSRPAPTPAGPAPAPVPPPAPAPLPQPAAPAPATDPLHGLAAAAAPLLAKLLGQKLAGELEALVNDVADRIHPPVAPTPPAATVNVTVAPAVVPNP